MRNKIKTALIIIIIVILAFSMLISSDNSTVSVIKTSAQCEMCVEKIEKHLKKQKGIYKAVVDLDSSVCIVTYDTTIVSLNKISEKITSLGYDADDMPADKRAYKKLPKCCKKPEDR